jgi:hypothetical protein
MLVSLSSTGHLFNTNKYIGTIGGLSNMEFNYNTSFITDTTIFSLRFLPIVNGTPTNTNCLQFTNKTYGSSSQYTNYGFTMDIRYIGEP